MIKREQFEEIFEFTLTVKGRKVGVYGPRPKDHRPRVVKLFTPMVHIQFYPVLNYLTNQESECYLQTPHTG